MAILVRRDEWNNYEGLEYRLTELSAGKPLKSAFSPATQNLPLDYLISLGVVKKETDKRLNAEVGEASSGTMAGPICIMGGRPGVAKKCDY